MDFESIGIIPENGYNCQQNTSNKSQYWLKYLMKNNNINSPTPSRQEVYENKSIFFTMPEINPKRQLPITLALFK